jgi:glycosyltransferase involved in cell wall biosynthesis
MLSFCAIVKNEAANLARCLASVKPYVDEIIIVDTGSIDETVAIAQQYDAKVSHFQWCDDFAAARNYACSLASGEWILMLDADEELVASQSDWTSQLNSATFEGIVAFSIVLKDAFEADTELQTLRLFKNLDELKYCDRYHEYLTYQGQALGTGHPLIGLLQGVEIRHYGYANEILPEKSLKRIPILERIRSESGLSFMLLRTLEGMYRAVENLKGSESCFEEAWERLTPHLLSGELPEDSRAVRSWLYSLGVRSLQAEDLETARIIAQQGAEWFPDFPPLHYLNGLLLRMLGFGRGAIPYFELCLEAQRTSHYFKGEPFDQALLSTYPAFDIGTMYLELNQVQKAIAAFELALSFDPTHKPAQIQLDKAKILAHSSNSSK